MLWIGLATLAVTGVTNGMYARYLRDITRQNQSETAARNADQVRRGIELALASEKKPDLDKVVEKYNNSSGLVLIAIFRPNGELLASAGDLRESAALRWNEGSNASVSPTGEPSHLNSHMSPMGYLVVDYPIRLQWPHYDAHGRDELFGYVRVATNIDQDMHRLSSALNITSGVGLTSLILTIVLAFVAARHLVLPINDITEAARKLAAGDLSARSQVIRADELGDLARSFNEMASKLQRSHRDITVLNADLEYRVHQRTEHLAVLAHHDALTGLYNRRFFDEELSVRFAESRRYGTEFSCMMMDVDGFKGINDSQGHALGDEILRALAEVISSTLRSSDLAARYGGDEFVMLLPHTDSTSAHLLGERIIEAFDNHQQARKLRGRATVSIGVATARNNQSESPQTLLADADRALYEAKKQGKHRVVLAHALA